MLVQFHLKIRQQGSLSDISTIHFVETASSMLREMPWIQRKDSKVSLKHAQLS
jgi:hypothetical protein